MQAGGHALVYGAGLATVVITAGYATRLWLRTFFGQPRSAGAAQAHEPPPRMAAAVLVLAVPSALLGFRRARPGRRPRARRTGPLHAGPGRGDTGAVGGGRGRVRVVGVAAHGRRPGATSSARPGHCSRTRSISTRCRTWWWYARSDALAAAVRRADESGVDGVVEATGRATVRLGGTAGRPAPGQPAPGGGRGPRRCRTARASWRSRSREGGHDRVAGDADRAGARCGRGHRPAGPCRPGRPGGGGDRGRRGLRRERAAARLARPRDRRGSRSTRPGSPGSTCDST